MSAHTPGPWDQGLSANAEPCISDGMAIICRVTKRWTTTSPREWQANMQLIAAAPDLLEALTLLLELGRKDTSNPKYDGYYESARAAIHKATAPQEP